MTNYENYLSIARRTGFDKIPVEYSMCKSLQEKFDCYIAQNEPDLDLTPTVGHTCDISAKPIDIRVFDKFYDHSFKDGTVIDSHGVAHEPGSAAAFHMTKMYHPMDNFDSIEQLKEYPFLDYSEPDTTEQKRLADEAHAKGMAVVGGMQCTIWETSWYMRGMENLMMDMMSEDPMAEYLLDRVTKNAIIRAECFAKSGADVLFLGDDIGMQKTIMMSEDLYCTWLKPRLKRVIDAAKAINPDLIVFYHSCGYVTPMIKHLIEAGIDVLNPVQPECMDFRELHDMYGDRLSFHGTIGTQSTMPFGTVEDVRREVFKNLDIAGDKGGLFVSPTHLLEPEVPVENVIAYIKACRDYTGK